jgi:hypothetical protein
LLTDDDLEAAPLSSYNAVAAVGASSATAEQQQQKAATASSPLFYSEGGVYVNEDERDHIHPLSGFARANGVLAVKLLTAFLIKYRIVIVIAVVITVLLCLIYA